MTFFKKFRISTDYILVLFCLAFANIPYFAPSFKFYPGHDSMAWLTHFFYTVYNEYFFNNILALWLPYNLFGYETDYYLLAVMTPAQYFALLIGKLLGVEDALILLKGSMVIEQLAYVTGVYLLAMRLFRYKLTVVFVCIGAVFTIFWGIQYGFNFRFYYLVPFVLFFIINFFDLHQIKYLWMAGIVVVISLLGNAPYYIPIYILVYSSFFLVLLFIKRPRFRIKVEGIFSFSSLFFFFIFISLSFIYVDFISHMLDNTSVYTQGRDLTGKVSLENFLRHGGQGDNSGQYISGSGLDILWQFIYAAPRSIDFTAYIGLLPIIFLIYALFFSGENPYFKALTIIGSLFLLFSFGEITFIAPALYLFFPVMSYYRHISYLSILSKFFFLIASGFGIDRYFQNKVPEEKRKSPAFIGAVFAGFIIFVDIFVSGGSFPYIVSRASYQGNLGLPIADLVSYRFHFIPLFVLIFAVIYIFNSSRKNRTEKGWIIILLYLFEIVSYNFIIFSGMPVKMSYPSQQRHAFKVMDHSNDFKFERFNKERMYELQPGMPEVLDYIGTKNELQYSVFYMDACPDEIFTNLFRIDILPISFDRLINARLGRARDEMVPDRKAMISLLEDEVFMRAVGCNAPKLSIVSSPRIVSDINAAAKMIQSSSNMDVNPIIYQDLSESRNESKIQASNVPVREFNRLSSSEGGWYNIEFQQKIGNRNYPFWESNNGPPYWLQFKVNDDKYTNSIVLTDYKLQAARDPNVTDRMPTDWVFQGSNNGEEWMDLDKRTDERNWKSGEERTYSIANSRPLKFYRLYVTEVETKTSFGLWSNIKKLIKRYVKKEDAYKKRIIRLGTVGIKFKKSVPRNSIRVIASNTGFSAKILTDESLNPDLYGKIISTRLTANSLHVTTDAFSRDAWLVYLDNYHPGWKVKVNGQSRPIAQANIAFKAVKLDYGYNKVEFVFGGNHRTMIYSKIFFVLGIISCLYIIGLSTSICMFGKRSIDMRIQNDK